MAGEKLLTKEKFEELSADLAKIRAYGHELSRLGAIFISSLWELENELNRLYKLSKGE